LLEWADGLALTNYLRLNKFTIIEASEAPL
jgi:hypothetical protein